MRLLFLCIYLLTSTISFTQIYNRVSCEISIKEIHADGTQILTMGHVYFDKNIREIIYDISFPRKYQFAVSDYGVLNDSTNIKVDKQFSTHLVDFSVFNLVLSGKLDYFGLNNSAYQMVDVSNEDDMVISEWKLPVELGSDFGRMLVSQKNKQLYGLVSFDNEDHMLSQQFFTHYEQIKDMEFPTHLLQMSYIDDKVVFKKLITLRNIKLNEPLDENYRFNN